MGRTSGGYTIVEVMIVLAIAGVLLFSALTVVGGQQQKTGFTQAMQDVASTIQNYASQIQAGSYPSSENYSCKAPAGTRPQLISGAGAGDNNCIFLGRVFEVEPGSSTIHSIVVLGTRLDSSNQSVTSIDNANPEPARTGGNPNPDKYDLIDTYTIGAGATVTSSNGSKNNWDLIGLFSQLEGNIETSSGNQVLSLRAYPYDGQAYPYPAPQLTKCIEEQLGSPNCSSPTTIKQWALCMTDGSQTAALEVNANPSGLTSKLNYNPAAGECV
jgi:prepilin-type N-terminal cleavage/methylation domain-containing protein